MNSLNGLNQINEELSTKKETSTEIEVQDIALTELNFKNFFVKYQSDNFKYCPELGGWYIWNGKYWQHDDGEVYITDKVESMLELVMLKAQTEENNKLYAKVLGFQTNQKFNSIISMAKKNKDTRVSPSIFDNNPYLLNCNNGTVDLKTGILHPFNKKQFITKIVNTDYKPHSISEIWDNFISKLMCNKKEEIDFLQKALGYCITGSQHEKCFFMFVGETNTGKTTLVECIKDLLGEQYATVLDADDIVKKQHDNSSYNLATLQGKRFVSVSELEEGQRLSVGLMKKLTGSDTITVRQIYCPSYKLNSQAKIIIYTNEMPAMSDYSGAIWDRLMPLRFDYQFKGSERDKNFKDKLINERPAILKWLVDGAVKMLKDGLAKTKEMQEDCDTYQSENDVIGKFIEEFCEVGKDYEFNFMELQKSINKMAKDVQTMKRVTTNTLTTYLNSRGFVYKRTEHKRYWTGLKIKANYYQNYQNQTKNYQDYAVKDTEDFSNFL
jgi:putative DNA primase/helicase